MLLTKSSTELAFESIPSQLALLRCVIELKRDLIFERGRCLFRGFKIKHTQTITGNHGHHSCLSSVQSTGLMYMY